MCCAKCPAMRDPNHPTRLQESTLLALARRKLLNFKKRHGSSPCMLVKPEWVVPERFVTRRPCPTGPGWEVLVKWSGLGFECATWEVEGSVTLLQPEHLPLHNAMWAAMARARAKASPAAKVCVRMCVCTCGWARCCSFTRTCVFCACRCGCAGAGADRGIASVAVLYERCTWGAPLPPSSHLSIAGATVTDALGATSCNSGKNMSCMQSFVCASPSLCASP